LQRKANRQKRKLRCFEYKKLKLFKLLLVSFRKHFLTSHPKFEPTPDYTIAVTTAYNDHMKSKKAKVDTSQQLHQSILSDKKPLILSLIVAIVAFGVFANSLKGDFVYDDNRQILMNPLIQNPQLYTKALFSDVWAFKGDGNIAVSNYWRPTFVAWMIINFQLFGTEPFGWHLTNVLLHAFVSLLIFLLLYKLWGADLFSAFAISLIFAVHPVHVESVAWISGAPDLLAAVFLLASFWCVSKKANPKSSDYDLFYFLSVFFYAIAIGSKEIVFLCFLIHYLIFRYFHEKSQVKAIKLTLPFFTISLLYFVIRYQIIGAFSYAPEDSTDLKGAFLTAPTIFLFYLKQIALPVKLCANYSVQPVESLDFSSFFMPLILSAFILLLMALVARKSSLQKIGLMLFLLPLIPAMNASFFPRDNIVHDRYLYLPLLGFLMLILPELKNFVLRFETPAIVGKPERIGVGLLMLITLLLSLKTISYNQVWLDDLSVWEHAVRTDSGSASSWVQYGAELLERNRFEEAEQAYNRAIEIKPSTLALLGRGRSLIGQKKFDSAVEDLKKIIEKPTDELDLYQLFQSYEAIAIAYTEKGEPEKALEVLLQARKRLPIYYASLTVKTAIVLYQLNRKQEVLQELETVKERAKRELMPESKSVFFRLGLLYAEMGRKTEARANLQEFLRFSTSFKNKVTVREREIALEYLNKLK